MRATWASLTSSTRDALVLGATALLVWSIAIHLEVHALLEVMFHHETHAWLHAIALALVLVGIAGCVFALRRAREARRELRRRVDAEREASWLTGHDTLTGLANRQGLEDFVAHVEAADSDAPTPLVVFAVDIDGFKRTNDLFGHAAGDRLLRDVAERLQRLPGMRLVARLGGDEFLLVAEPGCDAESVAEEIRALAHAPVVVNGIASEVGACVGYARVPEDAESLRAAVQGADIALHAAKSEGRDSAMRFDESLAEGLRLRAELERDLDRAIREGLVRPHYQPIVDLACGRIQGFEALARWTRPGLGPVSPGTFIPLAEETGLMPALFESLLKRACRDAIAWPKDVVLSFNLSPVQLVEPTLGLRVLAILGETGLSPQRLEIEVTESALVRDVSTASRILEDLHRAGVRIAIDDFGTGYSSLAHLSHLAFDRIKIDKSFVDTFLADPKQRKIVDAVVALARALGVPTTAEGIETTDQLAELKALGCRSGQGFLFGRAMTAREARALLAGEGRSDTIAA
ncbi:putative bifunctional diguanylate cyclase/phosphodiesterase [Salinarimonas ramus]|uniref:Diguanylate cyclase (GGDEF) domain-containing protein n=1 Tax=Salinarimonas ramus TaxID=690164 RepID=A0A917QGE2_9HYPH|nr:EAL domain-containing protein [Salinarimonas ramus]GGK49189.1 hypothetical protein GCM10011322_40250 [Salinarimonas ramus]